MGNRHSGPLVWLRVTLRQLAKVRTKRSFDPAREAAFQAFHADAVYGQARFGVALGFVAWSSFAVWDALGFPSICGRLIAIRLLLVAPILVWLWWRLSSDPLRCKGHLQTLLVVGPVAASGGLLLMMWTASVVDPGPAFQMFWPAFSGLYFFLYAFLGLQFRPAAIVGNLTFFSFLLVASSSGIDSHNLGAALFHLGILNFIGLIVCARSEIHLRASFRVRQRYSRQVETARQERANAQASRDEAMLQRARAESALEQLEEKRLKLEAVSEEKERFFSAAYHDLQQPLSIIGLYAHLARSKLTGPQTCGAASDLRVIERAGYDIGLMFKGVRDTWEIGRTEPVMETFDLVLLLEEIRRELTDRADQKGLAFRIHQPKQLGVFVRSDRTLLKRAVSNLVSNAIKYTERGGLVLGAMSQGRQVRIDVRDTGIGIAPEIGPRIFDPYFQVSNPERNRALGLGLGLAIVRQIEQLLPDHCLEWTSRPGRGSRFALTLPGGAGFRVTSSRSPLAAANRRRGELLSGKYVLIVEDEPAILSGLLQTLKSAGCIVDGAESAAAAERLLTERDRCPDLLVTDFRLEHGATGLDVVDSMQQSFEWAASTPVLFVTGELMPHEALAGFRGPHEVYPKPIEQAELLLRATRLLEPEPRESTSPLAGVALASRPAVRARRLATPSGSHGMC